MATTRAVIQARATEVAKDSGQLAFPFCPYTVASTEEIQIEARQDMHGATGAIFLTDDPVIFPPKNMSEGLLNFTLGHELAHYFLSDHPAQIIADGGKHFSRGGAFSTKKPIIEREADFFSANFLMPRGLTTRLLEKNKVGLDGILNLHETARSSITSAAIRTSQCDPYPIMMVMVGNDGQVEYAFTSPSFRDSIPTRQLARDSIIPNASPAYHMSNGSGTYSGEREQRVSSSKEWFGEGNRRIDEECYHLGPYGTLVILTGEAKWEEDDEEEELIESWTPRFKR